MTIRHLAFFRLLQRLLALGGVALVLALAVFAACPELHEKLHAAGFSHDDGCAIALFAAGASPVTGSVVVTPPAIAARPASAPEIAEICLVSPRYLRQPERGPPSV